MLEPAVGGCIGQQPDRKWFVALLVHSVRLTLSFSLSSAQLSVAYFYVSYFNNRCLSLAFSDVLPLHLIISLALEFIIICTYLAYELDSIVTLKSSDQSPGTLKTITVVSSSEASVRWQISEPVSLQVTVNVSLTPQAQVHVVPTFQVQVPDTPRKLLSLSCLQKPSICCRRF